jgi:phosphate/sulfate permease
MIIIIVTVIVLAIAISIFLFFLIRKLSKKKNDLNIVSKYGLPNEHKRSIKNIKNKPYNTSTTQTIQTTKRSIKNKKDPDKLPSKISKVEINLSKKDK